MSRHTAKSKCGRFAYAWGYDRPNRDYFFQKIDKKATEEEDYVVFSIAMDLTTKIHPDFPDKLKYTEEEIIRIMEQEMEQHGVEIPYTHRMSIAFNWAF